MARILIVDDEESARMFEETIITDAGHDVCSSPGAEQALRQYLENDFDLVITDLQMPDLHGFELISILRDLIPSPPVIAVSGAGETQLLEARRLGAVATLAKPIDAARLLRAVDEVLATEGATIAG